MNENHCKHNHESNAMIYIPSQKGGKGLQQLLRDFVQMNKD